MVGVKRLPYEFVEIVGLSVGEEDTWVVVLQAEG